MLGESDKNSLRAVFKITNKTRELYNKKAIIIRGIRNNFSGLSNIFSKVFGETTCNEIRFFYINCKQSTSFPLIIATFKSQFVANKIY